MKHNPPESLMAILLTCDICMGATTYHDEQDGLCACNACQNGRIAVALPIPDFMAAAAIADDTARHAHLLACAKLQGKVLHPVLYNLDSVPSHYQTPLRPNPSDAKRHIPLTP